MLQTSHQHFILQLHTNTSHTPSPITPYQDNFTLTQHCRTFHQSKQSTFTPQTSYNHTHTRKKASIVYQRRLLLISSLLMVLYTEISDQTFLYIFSSRFWSIKSFKTLAAKVAHLKGAKRSRWLCYSTLCLDFTLKIVFPLVICPSQCTCQRARFLCVCVCVCVCQRKTKDRADGVREKVPIALDGIRTCISRIRAHSASDCTMTAGTPPVSRNRHFRHSPVSSIVKQSCMKHSNSYLRDSDAKHLQGPPLSRTRRVRERRKIELTK